MLAGSTFHVYKFWRMIQVSVIVPTYNRADVLKRALDSVAAQSFDAWELLIADDGSTDGTEAEVRAWHDAHPDARLTYLPLKQRLGVSAARNQAARRARGEWLAFLDSDDEWLPEKLQSQMAAVSGQVLVHSDEIWIRDGRRVNAMKKHAKSGGRLFSRCVELCCISPSAAIIKHDLFSNLGGFREDFPVCEDYELWLRICARFDVAFIDRPLLRKYGGHADQLSRSVVGMDYHRVRALLPFLDSGEITASERRHVCRSILHRTAILLNGYRKHGNMSLYAEVEEWACRAARVDAVQDSADMA
jgi:glycosyltransferase involved in cell wall biosynthesis